MEKIKQALEKARQEREGSDASSPGGNSPASTSGSGTDSKIEYQQTRVVRMDDAVLRRNRIMLPTQDDEAATAFKILRTQVEQRMSAQNWNALAVTSAKANEGKTLVAINLSVALAREMHRTVLLVDLDLRNPSIHSRFELEPRAGLVDYLVDDVPVSEILINPGIDRLVILPAGRSTPNSSELVSSPKMIDLVNELKSRYPSRLIIFDLPPMLSADDTLAFSPYVDTTLVVVKDGETTRDELVRTVEMLDGVHLLGTILNHSEEGLQSYRSY